MGISILDQLRLLCWKTMLEKTRSWYKIASDVAMPISVCFLSIVLYETMLGKSYNGFIEPYIAPLGLMLIIPTITTTVVSEKSTRLVESMKMMGLSEITYWTNMILLDGVIYGFLCGMVVATLSKIPHAYAGSYEREDGTTFGSKALFDDANFGVVLMSVWVTCVASVPFGFFLSVWFDKPKTAGQMSFIVTLAAIVFGYAYDMTKQGKNATLLACTLPPYAYQMMIKVMRPHSCGDDGCDDVVNVWDIVGTLMASSVGFMLLSWYLRNVLPSEFGVRKSVFFPITSLIGAVRACFERSEQPDLVKSISMKESLSSPLSNENVGVKISIEDDEEDIARRFNSTDFELVPAGSNLKKTVDVRGLRKTFRGGDGTVVAVDDLWFEMYEGQCFALLGHNGAGKTTTINMLIGLFAPDKHGSTTVYGEPITTRMDAVREVLGVCPQHDVLIPSLTSYEHIIFFAMLKGASFEEARKEANTLLGEFHLTERRDHFGHMLSGGMRRKLSTIIAMCGGSKFVVLDEPSSGMDPLARRELWESLKKVKKNRTLLLTTHYMDEADELGDRIGIMDHGVMRTFGTSSFLKKRFGCGYILECEMKAGMTKRMDEISQFVTKRVHGATFDARASYGLQLVFVLPFDSSNQFGAFFEDLDKCLDDLGLSEYGVSVTSMEDVFLQVGREDPKKKRTNSVDVSSSRSNDKEEAKRSDEDDVVHLGVENQGRADLKTQMMVMVRKRIWTARNDYRTIFMILIPCLIELALFVMNYEKVLSDERDVSNAMTAYFSMLAYLFLPGLIAAELVRERANKLRYTLTVMGCRQYAYFGGMFAGDYIGWVLITVVNWIIIFSLAGADYLNFGGILVLLPFYGIQLIGFSYWVSFFFSRPAYAIVFTPALLILVIIFSQILGGVANLILTSVDPDINSDVFMGIFMWSVTVMSPIASVGTGLLLCTVDYDDFPAGAVPHMYVVMAIMLLQGALFMYRAIQLDARSTQALVARFADAKTIQARRGQMHEDVRKEAELVDRTNPQQDRDVSLQLKQMRKVYPRKGRTPQTIAVKGVSLQVRKTETLGLLGPNGAGKSTTLNMLLRSVNPTKGDAFICGHSILTAFERGALNLGVVPQDNNLWPLLSCEQHLSLFAELRGVPHQDLDDVVNSTLRHLELEGKAKTLSSHLSGGMQRRLCTAIALIGEPDVILLDEPSAGLDPASRRNLWDVIRSTMADRAVILTTHSMEEAEALSTRIGIMVEGNLQCIGTPTHLKRTLGQDFEIVMRLNEPMVTNQNKQCIIPDEILRFMTTTFGQHKLVSAVGNGLHFDVKKERMKIGKAFGAFEKEKKRLNLMDYQISQPTLEQVFIRTVLDASSDGRDGKKSDPVVLGGRVVEHSSSSRRLSRAARSASFSSTRSGEMSSVVVVEGNEDTKIDVGAL